jgi:hypothetical protein
VDRFGVGVSWSALTRAEFGDLPFRHRSRSTVAVFCSGHLSPDRRIAGVSHELELSLKLKDPRSETRSKRLTT